ncbi:hypothetical protein FQN55_001808 [Onygenales sp. PD_40]|nr:hypothetical protein FQN55_001808 [Onygenales sp. PD_40]
MAGPVQDVTLQPHPIDCNDSPTSSPFTTTTTTTTTTNANANAASRPHLISPHLLPPSPLAVEPPRDPSALAVARATYVSRPHLSSPSPLRNAPAASCW